MKTPTPETDKESFFSDIGGWVVSRDFSRNLERERDEWKCRYDVAVKHRESDIAEIERECDRFKSKVETLEKSDLALGEIHAICSEHGINAGNVVERVKALSAALYELKVERDTARSFQSLELKFVECEYAKLCEIADALAIVLSSDGLDSNNFLSEKAREVAISNYNLLPHVKSKKQPCE